MEKTTKIIVLTLKKDKQTYTPQSYFSFKE